MNAPCVIRDTLAVKGYNLTHLNDEGLASLARDLADSMQWFPFDPTPLSWAVKDFMDAAGIAYTIRQS